MYQPGLSGLEGIHLLLSIKGSSTFIVLHVLSHLGTPYRHTIIIPDDPTLLHFTASWRYYHKTRL